MAIDAETGEMVDNDTGLRWSAAYVDVEQYFVREAELRAEFDTQAEAIMGDRHLSDEGKKAKLDKLEEQYHAQQAELLETWEKRLAMFEEGARRQVAETDRGQTYHVARGNALATLQIMGQAATPAELEAGFEQVLLRRDRGEVEAWAEMLPHILQARAMREGPGKIAVAGSAAETLFRLKPRLAQALEDVKPERVRKGERNLALVAEQRRRFQIGRDRLEREVAFRQRRGLGNIYAPRGGR